MYIDKRETANKISVESDINRHVTGRAVTVNTTSSINIFDITHHDAEYNNKDSGYW